MEKPAILVVDDEAVIRQLFKRTLAEKNYHIQTAENGNEALSKIEKTSFNLLVVDLKMPGINGTDVLKQIKKINPYVEVIIITGYPTVELAVEAIKIGAFDFICKPFDMEKVESAINRCLERKKFNIDYIQLSELMSLFEISKTVTLSSNLDNLLSRILDSALEMTKAKKGMLLIRDEKTRELNIKIAQGLNKEVFNARAKLGEGISGKVAKEGSSLLITNINEDPRFKRKDIPQWEAELFLDAPLISIPLNSKRNVLGVINVADKITGESFTEREQTVLSVLAGQAAVAIENTKLYRQLQDRVEELKQTINQLNQTQNQLIQTEKMAAVGRLAFGIAHEIRNPLAIILEGVEFLKGSLLKKDKLAEESVEIIKRSIDRANNIIIDLLKFSRASTLKLQPVSVSKILNETVSLFKKQANLRNVKIIRNFPKKDVQIKADYNILRQAFFNLCINAIDAMPKGGELSLAVRLKKKKMANRSKVVIEIADTGEGIPEDILSKIFDPFFTTKEAGKGTGLGLSIVHLILERHKGTINVESRVNKGTKFIINLPGTKNMQGIAEEEQNGR